jgi:ribose 5-phosphate isomerase A
MDQNEAKRAAALAALSRLPEAGLIGLGSGSTAKIFIDEVGALVKTGRSFVGVPTSVGSRNQAEALGIPLAPDEGPWAVEVCVDGADEVDEGLNLIKGGGAALLREKIVSHASRVNVIIVDESKLSRRLGEKWSVPVEVIVFGHAATAKALRAFGEPVLRAKNGVTVTTDAGNLLYDVRCGAIEDPGALEAAMDRIPGVVETGLFVGRADVVIVAGTSGIRELIRSR